TPVVDLVERLVDEAHRAGVEVELAAAREMQAEARLGLLARIDPVAAEHHEVDPQRKRRQLDQEMLAPAAQRDDALADEALLVDPRVALDGNDAPADEALRLVPQADDRRPFGHGLARDLA